MWSHAIVAPIEVMNRLLRPTLPAKLIRRWRLDWDTREDCIIMIIVIIIIYSKTWWLSCFCGSLRDDKPGVSHVVYITTRYRGFLLMTYNKIRRPSILFDFPEKDILTDKRFFSWASIKTNLFIFKKKKKKTNTTTVFLIQGARKLLFLF